jgi:hypothetical protein
MRLRAELERHGLMNALESDVDCIVTGNFAVRKGTRGLVQLLEEEVSDAFEERKNLAKKSGEEAGTKMLFPMMMMFGIIIVIIMVPAFLSLQ